MILIGFHIWLEAPVFVFLLSDRSNIFNEKINPQKPVNKITQTQTQQTITKYKYKHKHKHNTNAISQITQKHTQTNTGNADRCLDCAIQHTCPYSSTIIYLDRIKSGHTGWPVNIITNREPDIESVLESLKTTNYGKCAYEMDNDVCDNQVVNLQFANGVTATFTMIATSKDICVRKV